jgi:hypothetical protein
MKKLSLRMEDDVDYPYDVDKIVDDFKKHGYEVSRKEAETAWSNYSDTYSAGWLCGVENEDTFYILSHYFDEEDDNECEEDFIE